MLYPGGRWTLTAERVASALVGDDIDAVVDEVIVDAYGEHEQLWAFRQFFEDEDTFPCPGQLVGTAVDVVAIDYDGDERRGLVAVRRRDGASHRVSLRDIAAGAVTLRTAVLLAAYRRWWGPGAGSGR